MLTEQFCPAQQVAECTSLDQLPAGGRGGWAGTGVGRGGDLVTALVGVGVEALTGGVGGMGWRHSAWPPACSEQRQLWSHRNQSMGRGSQGGPAAPRIPGSSWLVPDLSPQI